MTCIIELVRNRRKFCIIVSSCRKKIFTWQKITAAITAVGGYVPEDKLTNADLEKMVDTNDEWIRTRTGISERRILKGEGHGNF